MDTYLFSRPYESSIINNIDISPYKWLNIKNNEVSGIWIDIQQNIYNRDTFIIEGYKIEKVLRKIYKENRKLY